MSSISREHLITQAADHSETRWMTFALETEALHVTKTKSERRKFPRIQAVAVLQKAIRLRD